MEIERRGLRYPDDLGIAQDAVGLSARCAELRDRLLRQGERAEAAEAEVERLRAGITAMDALIPAVMDALESDARIDVRRAAFESIQIAYDEPHPWAAALRGGGE